MKYTMSIVDLTERCDEVSNCKECDYEQFCDYISRTLSNMTPRQMIAVLNPEYATKLITYEVKKDEKRRP